MKNIIRIVSLIGLLAVSQIAYSAPGGGGGGGGNTAPGKPGDEFSGYGSGFSPIGSPKNVTITSWPSEYGGTNYSLRIFFASSTEMVSIDGGSTQRPFFGVYPFVETDYYGNVIGISNFIETPDTEDYIIYNIEESYYDLPSLTKIVTSDYLRETFVCEGGGIQICQYTDTLTDDITFQSNGFRTQVRAISGPFTVNGMTFNDVRVENRQGPNSRTRIRAKGIGEVYRNTGGTPRKLIYYRANGVSEGTLNGTPFDYDKLLFGFFF